MGRRGPAPKPNGLRLIEGTDSKGRSGRQVDRSKEPLPPEGALTPPYRMSAEAQAVWDRTVADLQSMGLAAPSDARTLAAYCEACVNFDKSTEMLNSTSLLVRGDKALVINKMFLIQERSAAQILRFAQEFGLTPSARSRVEVTQGVLGKRSAGRNPFAG
jgi:P27 family predicted phage terminase small subunit